MPDWPYFEPLDEDEERLWDPPPLVHFKDDFKLPFEAPALQRKGISLIMNWVDRLSGGSRRGIDR
jgi:hypothetical protein